MEEAYRREKYGKNASFNRGRDRNVISPEQLARELFAQRQIGNRGISRQELFVLLKGKSNTLGT